MRLFIAEKPEVAKAIAKELGTKLENNKHYILVGNNIVTWLYGHILTLKNPDDYNSDYKKWNFDDLPLKVNNFEYKPIESLKNHLKSVIDLIKSKDISEIVSAGDADEEGSILVDEVLIYAKNKKPILRMFPNDITSSGIKKAINEIKPEKDFRGLVLSGYARSYADWIVGMNLTRAFTLQARKMGYKGNVISIGRVQIPLLSLVVNRDLEHENHKKVNYYELETNFLVNAIKLKTKLANEEKILDRIEVEKISSLCNGKNGTIIEAKHEILYEYAPLLYSLATLQIDCAKQFKLSPDDVMNITQNLREKHKLITYNRSDCQYLPVSFHDNADVILKTIKHILPHFDLQIQNADLSIKSRVFNDENITAHHAIIPTDNVCNIANLSSDEQKVYSLIAKRYISQFYKPREYKHSKILIECENYTFKASSSSTIDLGWKILYKNEDLDEKDELLLDLTSIRNGNLAFCESSVVLDKETKPRPYYKYETLLSDMTCIAKYVTDPTIKQLLIAKDVDINGNKKKGENGGIGTPATRSSHIKTLFDRGYCIKDKDNIISTAYGRSVIKNLPDILTKPDLTALWAEQQFEIRNNKLTLSSFIENVNTFVHDIINNIAVHNNFKIESGDGNNYFCPSCKSVLKRFKGKSGYFWACSNKECKKTFNDVKCKPDLKPKIKTVHTLEKFNCPLCNELLIRRINSKNKYWWGCSGFKNGCLFTCDDDKGKPILGNK